ncbi:MAG: cytochrome c peroxidase [Gemmatimonadota bacterium]
MERRVRWIILLVLGGSAISGCEALGSGDEASELDQALEARLAEAAPGGDLGFFRLPAGADLASIPQDPRNPLSPAKVELGRLLFHEPALLSAPKRPQGRSTASCASCHHARAGFQAGRRQGIGEGGMGFGVRGEARTRDPAYGLGDLDVQPIRSPSAMNAAYQSVMLWNGQFGALGPNAGTEAAWTAGTPKETNRLGYEGLETQAIAALGVHRLEGADSTLATRYPRYGELFAAAFPGQPIDRERAGLAIAAYERTLLADRAPFQRWLRGERGALSDAQKRGALVFFGRGRCATCHTGPALSSMAFYALGMGDLRGPDVFLDGGNELARPEHLGRGGFTGRSEEMYAFKVPQLYNLADVGSLGHGATFPTVRAVIEYKNRAQAETGLVPSERLAEGFVPLGLTDEEIADLARFLEEALYDPELERYVPVALPSGACFPVNDPQGKADLGC